MKIYINKGRSKKKAGIVKDVTEKLFPNAEIEVGSYHSKEDGYVIDYKDVYDDDLLQMAKNIANSMAIGVSEKVIRQFRNES